VMCLPSKRTSSRVMGLVRIVTLTIVAALAAVNR